jgi:glycosyltransferase involved in cell wall biosynthesis
MTLAIVIPYYKIEFLCETLESLLNQNCKKFNVYIGNDNSPADPSPIIASFKNDLSLSYFNFEKNFGQVSLSSHWNRCLDLLKDEEWVMILGDDDVLQPNAVEEFYKHLYIVEDNEINVIRYATQKINAMGEPFSMIYNHPSIEKSTTFYFGKTSRRIRSSLSEYVFKRSEFLRCKFYHFPLGWYSDNLAILEFSSFGNIYSINSSVIKIRVSNQSISGSADNSYVKSLSNTYFYSYLLKKYFGQFSQIEKIKILEEYEVSLKKINLKNFFFITFKYVSTFLFFCYLKFCRRVFLRFLRHGI